MASLGFRPLGGTGIGSGLALFKQIPTKPTVPKPINRAGQPVKPQPTKPITPISTAGLSTSTGSSIHPFGTPPGPTAPTAAQTAPTNSATTQTTPPAQLDSTALNNIATHLFDVNNQIGGLTQRQGYASTDLQNALAQLAYQQPRDQLRAEQAANNRGGLYSTVYNQQLGDLTHGYQVKQGAANDNYQRTVAALAAQIAALQAGEPLYEQGQAAESASRAAAAAAAAPPDLTPPPGPASPPPAASSFTQIPGQSTKALVKALSATVAKQPGGPSKQTKQELKKTPPPSAKGLAFNKMPIVKKAR